MKEAPASRTASVVFTFALAAALALAAACPGSAHAAAGERDFPLEITANAAKDGEDVVSVVVPSSVSIVVRTSVVDGRIMGVSANAASVSNNRHSFAPISVGVEAVADTPVNGNKLLSYVDMRLIGDYEVDMAEGQDLGLSLFDSIAPGVSSDLGVNLQQRDAGVLVPAGSYNVRATLLVSPVEEGVR